MEVTIVPSQTDTTEFEALSEERYLICGFMSVIFFDKFVDHIYGSLCFVGVTICRLNSMKMKS